MNTSRIIAAAVVVTAAGAVHADTIDVRFLGTGRGSNVRITHAGGTSNVFSGQLRHTLTNGTGLGATLHGDWVTFCADLNQRVTSSTRTYDVVNVAQLPDWGAMGVARANAIRDMYAFANGSQLLSTASNNLAAAFQLAVWEVVTDYNPVVGTASLSLATGAFRATKTDGSAFSSTLMSHVNSFFGSIGVAPAGGGGVNILGLRSGTAQDQIVPIPAPGVFALTSLGCVCLAGRRRR